MLLLHTNLNSFRWVLVFARCLTLVKFLFLNWCLLHKFGFSCRCRRSIQGSSICEVGETSGAATLCDIYNPIDYSSVLSNFEKTLWDYTNIGIQKTYSKGSWCLNFWMSNWISKNNKMQGDEIKWNRKSTNRINGVCANLKSWD